LEHLLQRKRPSSSADGGRSPRSIKYLLCLVTEAFLSNTWLDIDCTVGDCHDCPQSVQEDIVEVLEIGGQASNGIIFTALL
jgi:hypothetical protein